MVFFTCAGGLLFPVYFYLAPVAILCPVGNGAEGPAAGGAGLDAALAHDDASFLFGSVAVIAENSRVLLCFKPCTYQGMKVYFPSGQGGFLSIII